MTSRSIGLRYPIVLRRTFRCTLLPLATGCLCARRSHSRQPSTVVLVSTRSLHFNVESATYAFGVAAPRRHQICSRQSRSRIRWVHTRADHQAWLDVSRACVEVGLSCFCLGRPSSRTLRAPWWLAHLGCALRLGAVACVHCAHLSPSVRGTVLLSSRSCSGGGWGWGGLSGSAPSVSTRPWAVASRAVRP